VVSRLVVVNRLVVVSGLVVVSRLVVVSGLVVVSRLVVVSGLAPRWAAKRPQKQPRSCLAHCSALVGAASQPSAGQARSPQKPAHHRGKLTTEARSPQKKPTRPG